jgi:fimbrial isopeptide formation D2 family protein/LPXTG-motif cell wall-anchored protein
MAGQVTGGTTKLTIKGVEKGDQFKVYRLLNSTGKATGDDAAIAYYLRTDTRDAAPKDSATNAATANAVTDGLKKDAQVQTADSIEKQTDTVVKFLDGMKNSTAKPTNTNSSSDHIENYGKMDTWAKEFYQTYLNKTGAEVPADYTTDVATGSTDLVVNDIQQGYYLIVQSVASNKNAYSMILVSTADSTDGGLTVSLKRNVPTLEKKVKDSNESDVDNPATNGDWQDSADYDLDKTVPFQLTGTMPQNIAAYSTYKYVFHDSLSKGLTLDEDSIKVYVKNGGNETELEKAAEGVSGYTVTTAGDLTPAVNVNDAKLSADKKTEFDGANNFSVSFADLKTAKAVGNGTITLDKDSKIIVRYSAKVNDKAVIGSKGNPNEANLEFSNNPNYSGETQPTGTTPNDRVIVFTYEVDINKIDSTNNALEGATFKLEKWGKNETSGQYEWKQVGTIATSKQSDGKYTSKFQRVDDGKYRLTETVAPTGYTPITPKEFTITAEHDTNSADPKLTSFTLTGLTTDPISQTTANNNVTGIASADIVNTKGTGLPSTGGMGTTILYAAGAAIVLVAAFGIVFAVRRRNAR